MNQRTFVIVGESGPHQVRASLKEESLMVLNPTEQVWWREVMNPTEQVWWREVTMDLALNKLGVKHRVL